MIQNDQPSDAPTALEEQKVLSAKSKLLVVVLCGAGLILGLRSEVARSQQEFPPQWCAGELDAEDIEDVAVAIGSRADSDAEMEACIKAMTPDNAALVFDELVEMEIWEALPEGEFDTPESYLGGELDTLSTP
ncbi:MAG: hypothetical protein IPL60_08710 [Ardenticatenia bacterium]|nr:hypothetical protein [Ardenticatenia bacterium]